MTVQQELLQKVGASGAEKIAEAQKVSKATVEEIKKEAAQMKAAAGFRNAALKGLAKQFSQDSLLKTSEVVELQAKIQRLESELGQYKAKEEEEVRAVMLKRIENLILKWVYRSRFKRSISLAVGTKVGGELDSIKERTGILKLWVEREDRYLILLRVLQKEFIDKVPDSVFAGRHQQKFALQGFNSMKQAVTKLIQAHEPICSWLKQAVYYETGEAAKTGPIWDKIIEAIDDVYESYFSWMFVMQDIYARLRQTNEKYKAFSWELCQAVSATGLGAQSEDNMWYLPVIQMSNYGLLLQRLVELTPDFHCEHSVLCTKVNNLKETSLAVEKRSIGLQKLAGIQKKMKKCPYNYVSMDHHYVMEGTLDVKDKDHDTEMRVIMLLRELVILAKPSPDKSLEFEREIKFANCISLNSTVHQGHQRVDGKMQNQIDNQFDMELDDGEHIIFSGHSKDNKTQAWLVAFTEALEDCLNQPCTDAATLVI